MQATRVRQWLFVPLVVLERFASRAILDRAIVRDNPVEAKDHPELVLITAKHPKKEHGRHFSGALIAGNVVLTSSRCAQGFQVWEIEAPYAKDGAVRLSTRVARVHPDYDPRYSGENALALLILDKDIGIGRKFPTLYDGAELPLGTKVIVAGRADNGKVSGKGLFLSAAVQLVEYDGDSNIYGGTPHVVERGDTGGPVYSAGKDPKIVAVVTGYVDYENGTREPTPTDLFSPIFKKNKPWIDGVVTEARQPK